MADTTSTEAPSTVENDGGIGPGTQAPEGFVPLGDLEREQARARDFQATADRAKAELDALKRQVTATAPKPDGGSDPDAGFDPIEFRRTLMADATNAFALTQAASDLKVKFPLADASIYERLPEFGNVDALYLAVEASHLRVAAVVEAEKARIESELRTEFDAKLGGAVPPAGGSSTDPAGDPTAEQLSAMSLRELDAFEKANPGVTDRVLRSATA